MTRTLARGIAVALLAASGIACAGASQGTMSPAPQPSAAPVAAGSATQGQSSASAIARARADSLRYPYTAADVHFMTAMIGHHAQAIQMARLAADRGASPSVQNLADRILSGQADEIVTMQNWLRDRGQPVPEATSGPMKMVMNGMEHEMMMPGMLTAEQMAQLEAARGKEFDRLFLTFMIQHHRGAVSMVRDLFGSPGAAQDETVFKFANDVNVDQTTEIARMQRMLAALTLGITAP
jgi:uncharacterized protein (DUF305 family)